MSKIDDLIATLHKAADSNSNSIRLAFLAIIDEIRRNLFDTVAIEIALARGDINAAIEASGITKLDNLLYGIGMDKTAYIFMNQVNNIFAIGAATAISNLPSDLQRAISFDSIGPRAVNILRNDGIRLTSNLSSASREGVRVAIERTLVESTNPTKQAREIRQLIGLTDSQTQAVLNFRRQLEAQHDLGFTPPQERRLNAIDQAVINRHMREGHLTSQQIDDMVERYFQSMLNKRAIDISRTEAMSAVNRGQLELWMQGMDQGVFDENDRKFWVVTRDDRLRATHAAIPMMNPYGVKINAAFATPFGAVQSPGDYNIMLINCRCCLVLGWSGQSYTNEGYIQ